MNKLKKILLNIWYGLPFGLKAAGDEIMGSGEADQAGTEVVKQTKLEQKLINKLLISVLRNTY